MGTDSYTYTKVGNPNDVTQMNQNTDQFWNMLFGGGGINDYLRQSLQGALAGVPEAQAGLSDLITQITSATPYNPQQGLNAFLGAVPELQGIARSTVSPYGQTADELASAQARSAMSQVAQEYGNMGAINSGAAMSAMTRGAAVPRAQLAADLARTQSGAATSLIGQALQTIPGQYSQAYGFGQNQQQMGLTGYNDILNAQLNQAGLFGSLLGSVYGAGASLAQPQYYTPTYMQEQHTPWWVELLHGAPQMIAAGAEAYSAVNGAKK